MFWPGFVGYAVGFALWGMMIACTSGALPAYLHSELRAEKKEKQFARYFGWLMSAASVGSLVGYVFAAVFTLKHTSLLIGLSVASSAIFLILSIAPEHSFQKQATYLKTLKIGVREVGYSKKLRYMCYVLFAIFMVIGVLEELLPRVYADFGLTDTSISLLVAAAMIVAVLLLTRLESFVRISLTKQVLAMCAGVMFLLVGLFLGKPIASLLILAFSLVFQLFRPVFMHHVQEVAHSEARATIGSIPGLAAGLLGAISYVVIGKLAQATTERFSIGAYSFVGLVGLLLLAYMGRAYSVPLKSATSTVERKQKMR